MAGPFDPITRWRMQLPSCGRGAWLAATLSVAVGGCMVGPDYVRPTASSSPVYREAPPTEGDWKTAQPQPADGSANPWSLFGDATLDRLIADASAANQSVAQAEANYRASRAAVRLARSALYPNIGAAVGVSRSRIPVSTTRNDAILQNAHTVTLEASWEPDLWGGVRRSIEAADATAASSAALLAAARLSVQAEVANNYLNLRINDELHDLLARDVDAYQRALQLSQAQLRAGTVSRSDVALATAQLKSTQSLLTDTFASRALYEHAIALLLGKAPAEFTLSPAPLDARLPAIPVGLPSDLLERRPDIATAERNAAAANAEIGVAKAAYYPLATLSANGGDSLASLGRFFTVPGRVWTLGANLAQTLFDGGARRAQTDRAIATYDATVAAYRQTVLGGFGEVEDNLATLRVLEQEQGTDDDAVAASRDAERIATRQYRAGTTTYLSVITAQNTALSNERIAVGLRGRRFTATVALIRAIGGGWDVADAPPPVADASGPAFNRATNTIDAALGSRVP